MGKKAKQADVAHENSKTLAELNAELRREIKEGMLREKALRESEARYRTIFQTLQEGYFETDLRGRLTFFNEAVCRVLGYSREELLGMDFRKYTTPASAEKMVRVFGEILMIGKPPKVTNYDLVAGDGSLKTLEFSTSLIRDGQGEPVGFRGVARDVTERRQAEEALKASEKKYMDLVENSPDIVYSLDPEGRFTFVGGALRSLLGYSPQDLLGKHFQCIMKPEDMTRTEGRFNERRTGKRATRRFEICLVPKTKDPERKDPVFEVHAFGVYDEGPSNQEKRYLGTYGIARDISDGRRAEELLGKTCRELQETRDMLLQSEKLAAVGRLMSGVSQEILNPLNILSMRLQRLKSSEGLNEKDAEALAVCENQVKRIAKILGSLSQFSRVPKEESTLTDLNELVRDVLRTFAPQFKEENIRLQERYDPALSPMFFSKSRIEQVFQNIVSNALEAVSASEKRMITVTTTKPSLGDHVQVIVSDTGPGIDIQNMDRIFDPFFTTKKRIEKTGLGLFLSYGIVKDHGGRIWAENNDEGGASFFVHLPVVTQKDSRPSADALHPAGRETSFRKTMET
jgi:two-component system NtrC family sensor kinase